MLNGFLIKLFLFLFPFIKELVFGKEEKTGKRITKKPPANKTTINILIGIGCLSVVLNLFLLNRLYVIGEENHRLTQQLKDHKPTIIVPDIPKPLPIQNPEREQEESTAKPVVPNRQKQKEKKEIPYKEKGNENIQELKEINQIALVKQIGY